MARQPIGKKEELPEGGASGLMGRLRQQRENILTQALYHLEGQTQLPTIPAQPVLLPAAALQVGDIVRATRELVGGAIRLPLGSAGVVQQSAGGGFVAIAFDGAGTYTVPVHCLALLEPDGRNLAPDILALDLVAALAARLEGGR